MKEIFRRIINHLMSDACILSLGAWILYLLLRSRRYFLTLISLEVCQQWIKNCASKHPIQTDPRIIKCAWFHLQSSQNSNLQDCFQLISRPFFALISIDHLDAVYMPFSTSSTAIESIYVLTLWLLWTANTWRRWKDKKREDNLFPINRNYTLDIQIFTKFI